MWQYSLVVGVSVRAGAGLTVLRSANSGVTEEARSALLAQLALSVVQAALEGETHRVFRDLVTTGPLSDMHKSGASYRADASLRVAGVRVAVAFTELTVAQV